MEKIITNYLGNAMKFTPKDGKIQLGVERKEEQFLISTSDTGVGILPEDLPHIFDRFYQTKAQTRAQEAGTGIGLSLCQELAKVLGGKVWATSTVGKGSTFFLQLPYVESFAQTPTPEPEVESLPTLLSQEMVGSDTHTFRPHLLVVEDNADLRQYLQFMLQERYRVSTVENGVEALAFLQNTSPALVLSDIMMPQMDGIELLTALNDSPDHRHVPIIMLTARQSLEVKLSTLRIGVDDYLSKPFREAELLARIDNLLRNQQQRQNAQPTPANGNQQQSALPTEADLKWLAQVEAFILAHLDQPSFKLSTIAEELEILLRNRSTSFSSENATGTAT